MVFFYNIVRKNTSFVHFCFLIFVFISLADYAGVLPFPESILYSEYHYFNKQLGLSQENTDK